MFNNLEVTENLGRLKHTTKDDCSDCGEAKLQLRVRKLDLRDEEYLFCPKCGFEKIVNKDKQEALWKKKIVETAKEVERVESSLLNRGNRKGNAKDSRGSDRGSFQKSPPRFPK